MITITEPIDIHGSVFVALKIFDDGSVAGVKALMYHWTLQSDISEFGYENSFCYATREAATIALNHWDGTGDPVGWNRNPRTGRRRVNGDPKTEWVAW